MKIKCDREKLLNAFQIAAMTVPNRSPKPILQNIKLDADKRSTVVSATDMEISIRIDVTDIEVEEEGQALLPVGRFGSILRESSDATITLETTAQGTEVKGDHSEFKLPAADPEEFPVVELSKEDRFHDVPARLFKELIRRTLFATDTESSRYALGGVLLEMEDDKITAVGTDGRRLAKMEGPAQSVGGHQTGNTTTIVPSRSMQLIERALSDSDAEIQVTARTNDIVVKSPRVVVYSRLVEGRFPKWRDVLPARQNSQRIELKVGPVYAAVRQAAIVASEESRGIEFQFDEGSLVLSGATAEVGNSRVELPVAYTGQPMTVMMDHRFVADFLKVLDPEKVFTLDVENSESAALCTTDDGYAYVIMPLAREKH